MTAETWSPERARAENPPKRDTWTAIKRGLLGRCPHCGKGSLFGRYLKVVDRCEACGESYSEHRADDLPPYLTIIVVGHVVIPLVLSVQQAYQPPDWLQMAIWVPVTLILTLLLLQPMKGAVVGMQWANYMHGFHPHGDNDGADRTYRGSPGDTLGG
jgi:uncharacterized protein (DUF983 family)